MSNLLASLGSVAQSFSTYEQALQVISNDTTNATTPGYAKQKIVMQASSFDLAQNLIGGVTMGPLISSRDVYSENNVQQAQTDTSYSSQLASNLQGVEPLFSLSTKAGTDTGIAGSLDSLFSSFSQLATAPNDAAYRQAVLNSATNVAAAFHATDSGLQGAAAGAAGNASATVNAINALVGQIQQINVEKHRDPTANADPGVDAKLYSDLENLSKLVNITSVQASDGTTSILVGGQYALLEGTFQNKLSMGPATATSISVVDSSGNPITSAIKGGTLGAAIDTYNTYIPKYETQLNTLAAKVSDGINQQLGLGYDQNGASGAAIFSYNPANAARTMAFTGITADKVAASSAPGANGGNANAVALTNLQTAQTVGTFTYTQYYGNLSADVGTDSSDAQGNQTTQQQLLSQATNLRANISAVSLDDEAAQLTQYQQAYSASSKLISVIAQMTQIALGLIPGQ